MWNGYAETREAGEHTADEREHERRREPEAGNREGAMAQSFTRPKGKRRLTR